MAYEYTKRTVITKCDGDLHTTTIRVRRRQRTKIITKIYRQFGQ